MTTQTANLNPRACAMTSFESIREKAVTLRLMMLTVGMQLMLRTMLLLRRWNY